MVVRVVPPTTWERVGLVPQAAVIVADPESPL